MLPEIFTAIPGPKSLALAGELRRYESPNVTYLSPEFPIFWERAFATNVWDVDGNRFLDLTSGFGVASLGYNSARVLEAAQLQLRQLHHAMGDVHPAQVKVALCRALSQWTFETWGTGLGQSILTNSGAEAIESALKTALLATGRRGVISFTGAYHGLGYGALTVSGLEEFRTPFRTQLADFSVQLPFPSETEDSPGKEQCWEMDLRRVLAEREIGAILTEPIQGRAGVIVPPQWFLPLLRRLATEAGSVLILDEIYTGFYRTGPRFAVDASGVVPDLVCVGKALTNGFPLAACVGKAELMSCWPVSDGEALHTSTFLGNPLGCSMALAALTELEQAERKWAIIEKGARWRKSLVNLNLGPVRGCGLLLGLELAAGSVPGRFIVEGLRRGLILLAGGPQHNVLTFTPPFLIEEEELSWVMQELEGIARGIAVLV